MPDPVQALRLLLDDRDRRGQELRVSRVSGRSTDGTLQLLDLEGECVARGCRTAEAAGETVKRPLGPCWDNQGASGVAGISVRAGAGVLWLESIDPDLYEPGLSYTVEAIGRGFTEATQFEFLLPSSEEVNPDVTLTAKTFVDSEHYELEIEVDPAAAGIERGDVAYDDGGRAPWMVATRLRRRRSRMYDVRVPPPPAAPPGFAVYETVCGVSHHYAGADYDETVAGDVCVDLDYFWLDGVPAQSWMAGETEVSVPDGEAVMATGPGLGLPISTFETRLASGSYATASADIAATPAVYHAGFVWWCEKDTTGGLSFSLKRARPDLSEPTTIATGSVSDPSGGGALRWRGRGPTPAIAVGPNAVISEWQWTTDSPSNPALGAVRIRFPLPSGTFESQALPDENLTFDRAIADPVSGGYLWPDGTELRHTGGSTVIGLTWQTDYYPVASAPRQVAAEWVSVGPGDVLAVFGDLGGGRGFAVTPAGGPFGAEPPTDLYQLEAAPGDPPLGIGFVRGGP